MPNSEPQANGSGAMFDAIAARYDLLNRLLSLGLDRRWRRILIERALEHVGAGQHGAVLDLATGTADVAIGLTQRHAAIHVTGVDPSTKMLALGQKKVLAQNLGERIALRQGEALTLPALSGGYDAATIAFGIRNFPERLEALCALRRALKPRGRLAILELGEPRTGVLGPLARWHVHSFVPWLGAWLSGAPAYRYLAQSIAAFPPPDEFVAMMQAAGFENVQVRPLSFGAVHLFWGDAPAVPGDL